MYTQVCKLNSPAAKISSRCRQNILVTFEYKIPGGVLPYKRLMGMCRWMGSHFHDWSDYNGVAFSIELLEWGRKFSAVWGK